MIFSSSTKVSICNDQCSSVTFVVLVFNFFRSLPHSLFIHWSSCEMKTQRHSVGGCSFQWGFFNQWLFMTFFFPVNCFASSFVFFAVHFSWWIFFSFSFPFCSFRLRSFLTFMACVVSVCVTGFLFKVKIVTDFILCCLMEQEKKRKIVSCQLTVCANDHFNDLTQEQWAKVWRIAVKSTPEEHIY